MSLKAILFDFNGVIINDEPIHQELINEILIQENLRPDELEYQQLCLGRSDRACLSDILSNRSRLVKENYLDRLIQSKTQAYRQRLQQLETLPIYPDIEDLMAKIQMQGLAIAVVTGALKQEVELVLDRAVLRQYVNVIVAGDETQASKPQPDGYLLAVERLNRQNTTLKLQPSDCLAIEDTPAGIQAAKNARIQVVGVANTYPLHLLQRKADWVVDYLNELDLDRVKQIFAQAA
ncbi:MAG: HAD family phosphatase [Prochloraceae cyanobacterium]|nr:HAD family phosphatase [Prochloraceae cyanobacterium]